MYCNKCNCALNEGDHICPNCGFDNDATIDLSSVVRKISKKEEKKSKVIIVTSLLLLLSVGIVIFYLANENSDQDVIPVTTTTSTTNIEEKKLTNMTFNNVTLKYSADTFTKKDNTLFYKVNENINIVFTMITADEYNDRLNGNECLEHKLNDIQVKTFAGDKFYSYIFMLKDKYYDITVNYIDDLNIYNEAIQLEINQTLNTIKQK